MEAEDPTKASSDDKDIYVEIVGVWTLCASTIGIVAELILHLSVLDSAILRLRSVAALVSVLHVANAILRGGFREGNLCLFRATIDGQVIPIEGFLSHDGDMARK